MSTSPASEIERNHDEPDDRDHVCARCDGEQDASTYHHPRKAHRRQQCETVFNIFGTAEPRVVQSVTENLV